MPKSLNLVVSSLIIPKGGALLILLDEEGAYAEEAKKYVDDATVQQLIKAYDFKGKAFKTIEMLMNGKGYDRLILLGIGKSEKLVHDDWLKLGGAARKALNPCEEANILLALPNTSLDAQNIGDFAAGLRLAGYDFKKYKTKKDDIKKKKLKVSLLVKNKKVAEEAVEYSMAEADGVELARNLVNEPANILGTDEFVEEIKTLKKLGVHIEILDEKEMKKRGFNALLGVAQGSYRKPYLAIMEWRGGKEKQKPIAFVGKGVVFDSGGISLKPGAGMEDMKGDMGGAAAVTGLMKVLATRKAKVNAVGVVGLVENMPDAKAQRPGDIVTSLSGQTIEVINTDAEGRLVLADALYFTKERFQPEIMVNLATLTGAIMVALGVEYAGLFSNDDQLAERLLEAGQKSGEKLWRMPLSAEYDKIVDSKVADMRNSCGRYAGAITAAQFLQRFVGKTAWAHLDIAGTAMGAGQNEYNRSWGSGFGVRLLNRLIRNNYEG